MRHGYVLLFCLAGLFSLPAAQTNPPTAVRVKKSPPQAAPASKIAKTSNAPAAAITVSKTSDERAIDVVMAKFEAAVNSGNLTYPIEVLYTPVLNQMGGKAQALATAKAVQDQMKANKIRYVSWKAQKPYTFVAGTVRRYAIIHYEAVFDAAGKKLKVKNCLLGIKVSDATWQFIMGDDLNPVFNNQFLPDFPKNVVIPKPLTIPE